MQTPELGQDRPEVNAGISRNAAANENISVIGH